MLLMYPFLWEILNKLLNCVVTAVPIGNDSFDIHPKRYLKTFKVI